MGRKRFYFFHLNKKVSFSSVRAVLLMSKWEELNDICLCTVPKPSRDKLLPPPTSKDRLLFDDRNTNVLNLPPALLPSHTILKCRWLHLPAHPLCAKAGPGIKNQKSPQAGGGVLSTFPEYFSLCRGLSTFPGYFSLQSPSAECSWGREVHRTQVNAGSQHLLRASSKNYREQF